MPRAKKRTDSLSRLPFPPFPVWGLRCRQQFAQSLLGQPVVPLEEPLAKPSKGFVLQALAWEATHEAGRDGVGLASDASI